MIINHDKKIVVLLTPKTGSTTVRTIFNEWFVPDYGSHPQWESAEAHIMDEGFSPEEYAVYAFHRDPIDRVLSALQGACMSFIQLSPDRQSVQEFLDAVVPGVQAPPGTEDERDTQHIHDLYQHHIGSKALPSDIISRNGEATSGLASQLLWFRPERVQPLSYENYGENIATLCDIFGIDVPSPLPIENKSAVRWNRSELPQTEIDFIKHYYKKDYEFFNSKGIIYN